MRFLEVTDADCQRPFLMATDSISGSVATPGEDLWQGRVRGGEPVLPVLLALRERGCQPGAERRADNAAGLVIGAHDVMAWDLPPMTGPFCGLTRRAESRVDACGPGRRGQPALMASRRGGPCLRAPAAGSAARVASGAATRRWWRRCAVWGYRCAVPWSVRRLAGAGRGPAFRFVLVSVLRGQCPWLSVRSGRPGARGHGHIADSVTAANLARLCSRSSEGL
jgi:hypothetical protein